MFKQPPSPPTDLIGGHTFQFQRDPLGFTMNNFRQYGDVVAWNMVKWPYWQLNHPEDVREILLTQAHKVEKAPIYKILLSEYLGNGLIISDGDYWKRQHKLVQPAFHRQRIDNYANIMVEFTQELMAGWHDEIDLYEAMSNLTLCIVVKTLFSSDIRNEASTIGAATIDLHDVITTTQAQLIPLPDWIPTPLNRRKKQSIATLHNSAMRVIEERRHTGEDQGDLLSMLLMSETEDGQRMTDRQVMDEAINIFLAGHDTTANALTWTWVLLAQHPEVEARLHAEIDAVLGGRPPTLADLPRLKYAEMVVKESLRFYPPVWSLARTAIEDIPIHNGYVVPKGMNIFISQYVLHHDPRWFPDPERFDPERFSPENEPNIPKYAYTPFSFGPRICIGNMFAMMEATLVLATMAQQYQLRIIPGDEPEIDAKLTLNPKRHFKMALAAREPVLDLA